LCCLILRTDTVDTALETELSVLESQHTTAMRERQFRHEEEMISLEEQYEALLIEREQLENVTVPQLLQESDQQMLKASVVMSLC